MDQGMIYKKLLGEEHHYRNKLIMGDGYFYLKVRGYDNHYQTFDAVEHPETREVNFVTPYPWTGWEHENAEW